MYKYDSPYESMYNKIYPIALSTVFVRSTEFYVLTTSGILVDR